MTNTPSADYPLTTLRTVVPAVGQFRPTGVRNPGCTLSRAAHRLGISCCGCRRYRRVPVLSTPSFRRSPSRLRPCRQMCGSKCSVLSVRTGPVDFGFKLAGGLAALDADQGDRVRAGQMIARLNARDIEAQVAVAMRRSRRHEPVSKGPRPELRVPPPILPTPERYRSATAATNSSRAAMLIRLIVSAADENRSGANQMRQHLSFREHFRRGNGSTRGEVAH